MRLRGNEKYCLEEIELKELWFIMMILDPYEKNRRKKNQHGNNKIAKKIRNL
jgi:hypothetical protein